MNKIINHAAYRAEKEANLNIERSCSNCRMYVNGFCVAYDRAQPVFKNGYCNRHKLK